MLAKSISATVHGAGGRIIQVECDMTNSLPNLTIVGLAGKTVDEAKERLRRAIRNSKLDMPAKRFIINLAPADVPKDGSSLDLAMAAAILTASRQLGPEHIDGYVLLGELALDGSLRPLKGTLALLQTVLSQPGVKAVVIPSANQTEAGLLTATKPVYHAKDLKSVY